MFSTFENKSVSQTDGWEICPQSFCFLTSFLIYILGKFNDDLFGVPLLISFLFFHHFLVNMDFTIKTDTQKTQIQKLAYISLV